MSEINIYEKDTMGNDLLFDVIIFHNTPNVGEIIFIQDLKYKVLARWYHVQQGIATTNIRIDIF